MIGLDTNLIVRLVVGDNNDQAARAREVLEERCSPDAPGLVNLVTLTEVVWVLGSSYGYGRPAIEGVVETLLRSDSIKLQSPEIVEQALGVFRSQAIGFADALIMELNLALGCQTTLTFDRRAAKVHGFASANSNAGK